MRARLAALQATKFQTSDGKAGRLVTVQAWHIRNRVFVSQTKVMAP